MYFKIQPEQIQLHAFSSPSGDVNFNVGTNTVYANLSRYLTGSFFLTGGLTINNQPVLVNDSTNSASGINSFVVGGTNNAVIGNDNMAVSSKAGQINGSGNASFNARSAIFNASSKDNTILAGTSVTFNSGVTGATAIKDQRSASLAVTTTNSLNIDFLGGTHFKIGKVFLTDDLRVGAGGSGLFSGNLNVLGAAFRNGVALATTGDLGAVSGFLTGRDNTISGAINTRINATGQLLLNASGALSTRINATGQLLLDASGALSTRINNTGAFAFGLSGKSVLNTGAQTISGNKTFHETQTFSQSLYLKGNSGILSGISGRTQIVPTSSGHATGERGLVAYSGAFLYLKISDSPHIWVRHSGQLNWP